MQKENKQVFTSKIGFILASVGSAVGMGNIWMFPYRVGKYGGATFLILYFAFVALFGAIGLSGEFALGRLTGTGPIGSYDYALKSRGKKGGSILGTIPLVGILGISVGYAVIVGWVLNYFAGSVTGSLFSGAPEDYFAKITGSFGSIPWHIAAVVIAGVSLLFGIIKGIEKVSKIMMPVFFVLFVIIAVRVAFLPGAEKGYEYLLVPKWEYFLNPMTWIMAMGQAFFSLSITGASMIVYGSYLSKKEDIVQASVATAVLDTVAAMLAAFAIIPAVFAFGMDPMAGPPLMFLSMPKIFAQMPMGQLFSSFFFLSVLFAGVTSLINMLEAVGEALGSRLHMSRKLAITLTSVVTLLIGIFIEKESTLGTWMDAITIYIVPIGAVLGAVIIYMVLGKKEISNELSLGRKKPVGKLFLGIAKFVYIPLAVLVLILSIAYGGIG